METASKNSVVHCDICQEPMSHKPGKPSMEYWACYPCNNLIYGSDLWRYDTQVQPFRPETLERRRKANATSGD